MQVHGKVWGTTSLLFAGNNVEVHRITGLRGGYSSRHHHAQKHNLFFVERGALLVRVWSQGVDETTLTAGMSCSVAPGVVHQFEVLEEGTVGYEIYWVALECEDIVRRDTGGLRAA